LGAFLVPSDFASGFQLRIIHKRSPFDRLRANGKKLSQIGFDTKDLQEAKVLLEELA